MLKKFVPVLAVAALLAGCQSTQQKAAEEGPSVVGGVINSQYGAGGNAKLASAGVGTLLGAFIGKEIGQSLDKTDQQYAEGAAKRAYAAPVGDRMTWSNPQSGNHGTIATTRDGYNSAGTYCREYQQTVTVCKRTELAYGTACKQADGTWKIVSNA